MGTADESRERTYMSSTESDAEAARLVHQDQFITATTGMLPRGLILRDGQRVLDVACGPGGWACVLARSHPEVQVVGVDIGQAMIDHATTAAREQDLSNVSFHLLDVTGPWELPDASFDLVNARLMVGFLTDEKWRHAIGEIMRVLVPGGTVVLTENDDVLASSLALETLKLHVYRSARRAGLSHHPLGHHFGITPLLGRYLREAGFAEIQQEAHVLDYSAGMPGHRAVTEVIKAGTRLVQPFIVRQGLATQQELDGLHERSIDEMESPDFRGLWYFLRIWGGKPVGPEDSRPGSMDDRSGTTR